MRNDLPVTGLVSLHLIGQIRSMRKRSTKVEVVDQMMMMRVARHWTPSSQVSPPQMNPLYLEKPSEMRSSSANRPTAWGLFKYTVIRLSLQNIKLKQLVPIMPQAPPNPWTQVAPTASSILAHSSSPGVMLATNIFDLLNYLFFIYEEPDKIDQYGR